METETHEDTLFRNQFYLYPCLLSVFCEFNIYASTCFFLTFIDIYAHQHVTNISHHITFILLKLKQKLPKSQHKNKVSQKRRSEDRLPVSDLISPSLLYHHHSYACYYCIHIVLPFPSRGFLGKLHVNFLPFGLITESGESTTQQYLPSQFVYFLNELGVQLWMVQDALRVSGREGCWVRSFYNIWIGESRTCCTPSQITTMPALARAVAPQRLVLTELTGPLLDNRSVH